MPRVVGRGATDTFGDALFYDSLLERAKTELMVKQTNGSRYSSKLGKNTAPNVLSLFLQTPAVMRDFQLPTYMSTRFSDIYRARAEDGLVARAGVGELDAAILAWTGDVLDEAGLVPRAAFAANASTVPTGSGATTALRPTSGVASYDQWSGDSVVTSGDNLAGTSPTTVLCATPDRIFYNFFFTKTTFREDMLRYRAGEALRSKHSLVLASNKLLLVHDHYNH